MYFDQVTAVIFGPSVDLSHRLPTQSCLGMVGPAALFFPLELYTARCVVARQLNSPLCGLLYGLLYGLL